MIQPPTHPEFPLPVPRLHGDLWDFDDFCSLVRSSVSYSISLHRESSRLGYSLSSPFPCPFQMQGPGWLQESTYSGSNPSQGVFFGALQGFFSLLIPNQQDQRAMRVPCTRDVLPRNSTAATDPYSQTSWVGPPRHLFWGDWRGSTHNSGLAGAPQHPELQTGSGETSQGLETPGQGLKVGKRTHAFAAGRLLHQGFDEAFN